MEVEKNRAKKTGTRRIPGGDEIRLYGVHLVRLLLTADVAKEREPTRVFFLP